MDSAPIDSSMFFIRYKSTGAVYMCWHYLGAFRTTNEAIFDGDTTLDGIEWLPLPEV